MFETSKSTQSSKFVLDKLTLNLVLELFYTLIILVHLIEFTLV